MHRNSQQVGRDRCGREKEQRGQSYRGIKTPSSENGESPHLVRKERETRTQDIWAVVVGLQPLM